MVQTKGIILAGGAGTRLYPSTRGLSKQALPVYDKPMIYYPLSVLMLSGIREVLIISTSRDLHIFQEMLGNGSRFGIDIEYAVQKSPNGLAEAFIIGEEFIGNSNVSLILGDNIYYGHGLSAMLESARDHTDGATIFTYPVDDPSRFGVVSINASGRPVSLVEKPIEADSNLAITGLYFFDSSVVEKSKSIKPSSRGELEIVDVLRLYQEEDRLKVKQFGRGMAWLDTGTHDSLFDASAFVASIQKRQGILVACLEEVAYLKGFISIDDLYKSSEGIKSDYGKYIRKVYELNRKNGI